MTLRSASLALAVTILALATVSAVDSASAGGLRTENFHISTLDYLGFP